MTKLGLVKNYLKFKLDNLFGVIGCGRSNIRYLPNINGDVGTLCMVGFDEDVIIWNMKTNTIVETIHGTVGDQVTFLSYFHSDVSGLLISIGYESGYVSVYSLWKVEKLLSLKCHKYAVSHIIHCEPYGEKLICGSKDTSIAVIDIFEEKGFELKGHTSPITKLQYLWKKDILISSSADGNIKFWNIEERHCFKTLSNTQKAWDFHFCEVQSLLITGSDDEFIRIWKLSFQNIEIDDQEINMEQSLADAYSNSIQATFLGSVARNVSQRIVEMKVDQKNEYLICNTASKKLQVYKILSEAQIKKKQKKKLKKMASTGNMTEELPTVTASDWLSLVRQVDMPARCKTVDVVLNEQEQPAQLELLVSMHNNSVAVAGFPTTDAHELLVKEHVTQPGHRTAVLHVQITSDGMGVFSVSMSEAKLWDKSSLRCMFTLGWSQNELKEDDMFAELRLSPNENLVASAGLLLPGDRHALIGYKNGMMLLFKLVDGSLAQCLRQHSGTICSLMLEADGRHVLSAAHDDTTVTCWQLEYSGKTGRQLQMSCDPQEMQDDKEAPWTVARFNKPVTKAVSTPDGKVLVVAFLDNKVRTYLRHDPGRRVLDLHGHTEPVNAISVKHDNTQLLTASSDKTVHLWNLPLGDCKIFRKHQAAVTDVRYVPGRSMAFSADKAGVIIQFDTTNLSEIIRLSAHSAQICCLAVEAVAAEGQDESEMEELGGAELVSVSVDGSMRLWAESDEILCRELEREAELDRERELEDMAREQVAVAGAPAASETNLLTRKTLSTERCADELIESLVCFDRMRIEGDSARPDPRMSAMGITEPALYVLETVRRVKSGDLEFVLDQLPLHYVTLLVEVLAAFVTRDREALLSCRCLLFLAKKHFRYFCTAEQLVPVVKTVAKYGIVALGNFRDLIGTNLAAFEYFQAELGPELVQFTDKRRIAKKKKKPVVN